jgi:hypothetical protein
MPKAKYYRSDPSSQFELPFENVPLLWQRTAKDVFWVGGIIDGAVEVSYYDDGDWWISDVWIHADNGRHGADCRQKSIHISPDWNSDLRVMVIDSVIEHRNAVIEKLVEEMIAYEFEEAA